MFISTEGALKGLLKFTDIVILAQIDYLLYFNMQRTEKYGRAMFYLNHSWYLRFTRRDIKNDSLSKILLKQRQNTCIVGHVYNLKKQIIGILEEIDSFY